MAPFPPRLPGVLCLLLALLVSPSMRAAPVSYQAREREAYDLTLTVEPDGTLDLETAGLAPSLPFAPKGAVDAKNQFVLVFEGFQNHRWIDAAGEGGLMVGIRTLPDEQHPRGEKKLAWSIYQAIDTPDEAAKTQFVKDIIGVPDLSDNTGTSANPAYPARDYLVVTPSRYATALQNSYKSQAQTTAGQIKTAMTNYPGTIVVVNGLIEEELATGDGTGTYLADYSPFAVTEFRDWLRHTGMYDDSSGTFAGQGAPASMVGTFVTNANGVSSSPFYGDPDPNTLASGRTGKTFNATFGTSFTTWTCTYWDLTAYPNAITDQNFTPSPAAGATGNTAGGFDAPRVRNTSNAFWKAWSYDILDQSSVYPAGNPYAPAFGFRQVMIKHFVNDLLGWVVAAGIPKQIVYAHQIPGETAGATRARTGADPMWTGVTDFNGRMGVTRFGSFPSTTANTYTQNWGIFEWHPDPGAVATDPALYSSTISSLNNSYANGAHVLFPGWWENSNGATFLLTDSNFAVGLYDWLAAQPDLPPPGGQGLSARFFNNTNLTGTPVLARVDPAVNFVWSGTSPGTGVNTTNFSTIWSAWIQPQYSETYTFYTDTDDGVRLYINNAAVTNYFVSQSATELSGMVSLVAGQYYPITMQYFQGTGAALAQLSWSSASQPREIVPPSALFPALPTINWTNTMAGSSPWSTSSNWSGNVAPTSGTDAAMQFLGNQTATAGTLTADSGTAAFSLKRWNSAAPVRAPARPPSR